MLYKTDQKDSAEMTVEKEAASLPPADADNFEKYLTPGRI